MYIQYCSNFSERSGATVMRSENKIKMILNLPRKNFLNLNVGKSCIVSDVFFVRKILQNKG